MSDFSNWNQKDFMRWLRKNYPEPQGRWVEATLDVQHAPGVIFKCTLTDDYDTCIRELAWEMEINAAGLP
jgi:hypothetical protein